VRVGRTRTRGVDVVVWLCGDGDLGADDWTSGCNLIREVARDNKHDYSRVREFVITDGGAPSAIQRREYQDAYGGNLGTTAVVTTSIANNPLKRGIATAMSWMNPNIKFFVPSDVGRALRHVGIDVAQFRPIWATLDEMQLDLPPIRTLSLVGHELGLSFPSRTRDRCGPYEIVRRLGSGGTASVFEARRVDDGAPVALKVLFGAESGDRRAVRRTLAEGRAMAAVQHPNVVTVLDVGGADGVPYVAMELLEGSDLKTWIATHGPSPLEEAIRLFLPILSGVSAVHAAGLVHRDLKPSNVLLAQRGRGVEPVIVDFGIAKFVDRGASSTATTQAGMGTPQYMAPEQVKGFRATDKSDQYALAIVLYELVTGVAPFSGRDRYELLHAIVNASFVPPHKLHPVLPASFGSVVLRAMESRAEARFRDVRAFGGALLGFACVETQRRWRTEFPSVPTGYGP
jgi:hypothetical protein